MAEQPIDSINAQHGPVVRSILISFHVNGHMDVVTSDGYTLLKAEEDLTRALGHLATAKRAGHG